MAMSRLECCRPSSHGYGSGFSLGHSIRCPDRPGRKLEREERERLRGGLPLPLPPPERALRSWLRHKAGCPCLDCAYVEGHLDEEDDDGSGGYDRRAG